MKKIITSTKNKKLDKVNVSAVPDPTFPTNTIRTVSNRTGLVEDLTKTQVLFASDYNKLLPLLMSVFNTLVTWVKQLVADQSGNSESLQVWYPNANISIPNNVTTTITNWGEWDDTGTNELTLGSDGFFTNNTSRTLTVEVDVFILWDNGPSAGLLQVNLFFVTNGGQNNARARVNTIAGVATYPNNQIRWIETMAPGEKFRIAAFQNGGSARNIIRTITDNVYVYPNTSIYIRTT